MNKNDFNWTDAAEPRIRLITMKEETEPKVDRDVVKKYKV